MIFIGLDVSKISTAMCLEKNNNIKLFNYSTKKDNNIWVKNTEHLINYRNITYDYQKEKDYSNSQILKLKEFDTTTDLIINDIIDNAGILDSIRIGIEGYSYGSNAGPLIDIVEFTALLKYKLLHKLNKYTDIQIISPLTVKSECCKMTYEPRIELKGKKKIQEIIHLENKEGKQATKFDKWDMFHAFLDNKNINCDLKIWCQEYEEKITKNKEVPKPLDDIIDSYWIKEINKNSKIYIS